MSWAQIRRVAEASQLEYAKCEQELAELGVTFKLQVDPYGVWKIRARKVAGAEPVLLTARGGGSTRHRGEAIPRRQGGAVIA